MPHFGDETRSGQSGKVRQRTRRPDPQGEASFRERADPRADRDGGGVGTWGESDAWPAKTPAEGRSRLGPLVVPAAIDLTIPLFLRRDGGAPFSGSASALVPLAYALAKVESEVAVVVHRLLLLG